MKYSFLRSGFPLLLGLVITALSSCSYRVYVVRHAEKATSPANDPPLSAEGLQRSADLKRTLQGNKIKAIYSTKTSRTMQTAAPLVSCLNIQTIPYGPRPDSSFVATIKAGKKNTLVVGHSNTVDDLVNLLCGSKVVTGDLSEAVYDNLYIITMKGRKATLVSRKYGRSTP
jgi:phosphohistidine phosphatase SixA